MEPSPELNIHQRMIGILSELPSIGKNARNTQQNFNFRSVDAVIDALNPLLARWGVYYLPNVVEHKEGLRETSRGTSLYVIHLHVEFTFYSETGESVMASAWGEGSDAGDKATNKAMTAAQKYALVQAFCIATGETVDSDADSPEESRPARTPAEKKAERRAAFGDKPLPDGWADFDSFDDAHVTFQAGMGEMTADNREKVKAALAEAGIGWPMTKEQYDEALGIVERETNPEFATA